MIGLRQKVPLFLQMESAECGAACLAMVLAAHGHWTTLEDARRRCCTSRNGVDADMILVAAESYGLEGMAYRKEPETLRELPLPVVIHWNFDHFVVLESIGRSGYVILDPAQGRRKVDCKEFSGSFTGLALAFQPSANFERRGRAPSAMRTLMREAAQSRDALAVSFAAGFLGVFPALAMAGATSAFVDYVLGSRQSTWVPGLIGVLTCVIVIKLILSLLHKRTVAAWKIKIGAIAALRGFWRALTLPISFYAQRSAGEVVSRIRLGSDVGSKVAGPLADAMPQIALTIGYLVIMALFDTIVMWAALIVAAFNLAVLMVLSRTLADRAREHQLAEGKAAAAATSSLANLTAYRSMGREEMMLARWTEAEDESLQTDQRLGFWRAVSALGPVASGLLLSIVALVAGAMRAVDGTLTIGDLVALQMLAGLLNAPVAGLAAGLSQIQEATGALMRIADLESHPQAPEFAVPGACASPGDGMGRLQFCNLSFGYSPGNDLFKNIDISLQPGRLYALTGPSGSGKSTLARIAAGMLEPTTGCVRFDGLELQDHDHESLRRRLVYVGHDLAVFTGSIADNVTLWDPEISGEQVRSALQMTGFSDVLGKRSASTGFRLQPEAHGFSGGEMQRLLLARAMARNPEFLILDETTSALDTLAEESILQMLRDSGSAVLIVTHRPGTAMRCDGVIEVKDGAINRYDVESSFIAGNTVLEARIA